MKRPWLGYGLLAAGAYLLTLLTTFPAAHAYRLLAPHLPPAATLSMHAVNGTLWQGRAGTLAVTGNPLGALEWEVQPAPLLRGHLALRARLRLPDGEVAGQIRLTTDELALQDMDGRLPAGRLLALLPPGLPLAAAGDLALHLEEAHLTAHTAPVLRGTVTWRQAQLLFGEPLALGDLQLVLTPGDEGGSIGRLSDTGGPLEIAGTLTLTAARSYRFEARLRARAAASDALRQTLALLGRPDGSGFVPLRQQGRY